MTIKQTKFALPMAVAVCLLFVWECYVRVKGVPMYILPSPSKVLAALFTERAALVSHSAITLLETLIGLSIALTAGMVLAIAMDAFPLFKTAVFPLLVVSQTVPVIVLAPIFIIYLGFGMAPKILTVVLMCFFPIAISFADGMTQIDPNQINLLRSFGARKLQEYTMIKIPAAAPMLFSGLKVSATYSISGAVVGEWLSSSRGLGYYMLRLKNAYMLDKVFACVLVIILLSLLMNGIVALIRFAAMPYERRKRSAAAIQ